ncbi:MAG: hypothetical protein CVU71_00960 [Deltaproteobacteria bacterium HGW-Deltaproteobacteria-6]|jgi:hypothetical protein|nr:MAG: hypothetical protein CVU71_00960 [Deltaproteobacteria bacterium HGW-Deltaproteobacteria-6]
MKKLFPYAISIFVSFFTWIIIFYCLDSEKFIDIYDDRLQFAFFTAFLTVGSLLLAMKAFLLVRLKDDIYLHEEYQKRYKEQCSGPHKIDYFQGLKDIGYLLVVSVIVCFITSIAQITIGFCPTYAIKIIAPSLAAGMLSLVIIDWLFVYLNLRDWFSFIEIDIQNKLKKNES